MAGSSGVNDGLEQHIGLQLTAEVVNAWKLACPADAVKLKNDRLEQQKRSFDGTRPIKVELPMSLLKRIPDQVGSPCITFLGLARSMAVAQVDMCFLWCPQAVYELHAVSLSRKGCAGICPVGVQRSECSACSQSICIALTMPLLCVYTGH